MAGVCHYLIEVGSDKVLAQCSGVNKVVVANILSRVNWKISGTSIKYNSKSSM